MQGATQNDQVAVSDGSPNQLYPLPSKPAISGSIEVVVQEPGGPTSWRQVDTLATSTPVDRDYATEGAADGSTSLLFGDGLNGMIPPSGAVIEATYLLGGTTIGNVAAGIEFTSAVAEIKEVTIPSAVAGGTDIESVDRARRLAPGSSSRTTPR